MKPKPIPADVADLLHYEPETGVLRWKVSAGSVEVGDVAGCVHNDGYRNVQIRTHKYLAHRLAWFIYWGEDPKDQVDHVDRNRTNNAIVNLREATSFENQRNASMRTANRSGVSGVCWHKGRDRWHAKIRAGGKQIHLGYFERIEDAAAAYRAAAELHHREFAAHLRVAS